MWLTTVFSTRIKIRCTPSAIAKNKKNMTVSKRLVIKKKSDVLYFEQIFNKIKYLR